MMNNMEEWDPNLMSRCRSTGYGRRFFDEKDCNYEICTPYYQMGEPRRKGSWRLWIWRKVLGRKRKISGFDASTGTSHRGAGRAYDPCTYMQNFDRGSARLEPENLSRSFSVQFATPSGPVRRPG